MFSYFDPLLDRLFKRCTGDCCRAVTFAHFPRIKDIQHHSEMKHLLGQVFIPIPLREAIQRNPHAWQIYITLIGRQIGLATWSEEEMIDRVLNREVRPKQQFFKCLNFDEQTRRCLDYSNRPRFCRSFPNGERCAANPNCNYREGESPEEIYRNYEH